MQRFIEYLKTAPLPGAHLVHHEFIPSRGAVHGKLQPPLAPALRQALAKLDVTRLYQHQVDALSSFRSGEHVVIATPTASGKSLIYNLALLERLNRHNRGHGLYLFPLKALAQDQYQAFVSLNQALPEKKRLEAAVYDGDTPSSRRRRIKENLPHLIISNPDMLHLGLLPFHQQWEEFFRNLRLVVIDEVHTYRGIFGSHVVQILRRLQRVCQLYGSHPRYILLSATIANAEDFATFLLSDFTHNNKTTFIAPAAGFYMQNSRGVNKARIAYVLAKPQIKQAIEVIAAGLEKYSHK